MINKGFYNKKTAIWSLRLSVRTRGFNPRKRGSIPLGTAKLMTYFAYLLKSVSAGTKKTYAGYSVDVEKRLIKHNTNTGARSTRGYKWKIVYKKNFKTKSEAMSYEYKLKKDKVLRNTILQKFDK